MRSGTPGFQPQRLTEIRKARGLTQSALSQYVSRSSSTISKWEKGDQTPDPEALENLSRVLNVRLSYFLRPIANHGQRPRFFRSMASTTKVAREKAESRLAWLQDISLGLQEYVDFPDVDIPTSPISDFRAISNNDIEKMATECRQRWGLGEGPISDVLLVMENAGVIVAYDHWDTSTMDGLSQWSDVDARPYALLASDKMTAVRSRMDAAHELGHLVLHRGVKDTEINNPADFKEIERQAFYFASAFLMSSGGFTSEVMRPTLDGLLAMKERWKVSVAAMVMRCHSLGFINEYHKTRLFKNSSQRGWRRQEPLDDVIEIEKPRLLQRSFRLIIEESIVRKEALVEELRFSPFDIEELVGLPEGYLSQKEAEVTVIPKLKAKESIKSDEKKLAGGEVIAFPKGPLRNPVS